MVGGAIVAVIGLAGTTAAVAAAAINLAIGFAAAYFLAKAIVPPGGMSASDYKQQVQSDKEAQRVLYGTRQVSMVLNFAEEQDGTQEINDKNGQSYEKLYMSGMFCNHPVHNWYDVMLDDKGLSEYNDRAEVQWVNGTGSIPSILNETTQYQSDMTGSTGFWAALKLTHDREVFSGIPSLRVTVEGKKILDVRTGQMVFSDNAALVIYDFYVNYMRVNPSRLITGDVTGSFARAANVCDGAGYKINGMFMLNQKPSDILNEMLKSCGGTLVRTAGSIGLLPAAWYGPATFTIEESDIVGSISMAPQEAMGDAANVMKGTYVEPLDDWNEQDFEEIRDEALIARDGYEIADDISYSFVTSAEQARVLAHMELGRRTIGGATEIPMNPKGGYCRVGRVVRLELPQLGLSGDYRVINQKENDDLTFTIGLIRDAEEIYDGTVGRPYVPPPLLDTGGAVVPAPIGLQYTVDYNEQVGNTIQGKLTWSRGSASAEKHLVEVQDVDSDEIVQAGETNSYVFNVTALPAGNYKGLVRAVDTRGRVSAPADVLWSIGQPDAPSAELTEINNSNWSIELIPNIAGGTPQGTLFEFYYLADTDSYLTGQPSYDASSVNLAKLISTSSSLNHSGLTPDRWQHYYVRSINPYGVSDFVYFRTGTTNEESLVTTVVEKLKAVEIESENWLPNADGQSDQGYKLFSNATERYVMQDGTELTNDDASIDGLFVATNAEIRGHITAQTLTFVTEDSIPSEIDNSTAVSEANAYADAAEAAATITAAAYADGIVSDEEARAIADAQAKADQAEANANAAREAWNAENVYPDQTPLDIRGGGYDPDTAPNVGWGITSGGTATFNGNVYVNDGVVSGAIIVGAEIYGGSSTNICDPQNNGVDAGDIARRYDNHPDVPISCINQIEKTVVTGITVPTNTWRFGTMDTPVTFDIRAAADTSGSISTQRFLWGEIAANSMKTWTTPYINSSTILYIDNSYGCRYHIELVDVETGATLAEGYSPSVGIPYGNTGAERVHIVTVAGVPWRTIIHVDWQVAGGRCRVQRMICSNDYAEFNGKLGQPALNGIWRVTMEYGNPIVTGSGWVTVNQTMEIDVNNLVQP